MKEPPHEASTSNAPFSPAFTGSCHAVTRPAYAHVQRSTILSSLTARFCRSPVRPPAARTGDRGAGVECASVTSRAPSSATPIRPSRALRSLLGHFGSRWGCASSTTGNQTSTHSLRVSTIGFVANVCQQDGPSLSTTSVHRSTHVAWTVVRNARTAGLPTLLPPCLLRAGSADSTPAPGAKGRS